MVEMTCMCMCHWDGLAPHNWCPDSCCGRQCSKYATREGEFDAGRYQAILDAEWKAGEPERKRKEKEARIRKRFGLSKSQTMNLEIGRFSVRDWEETMDRREVEWCLDRIRHRVVHGNYEYADSYRAARAWKSSQVRRFKKLRTCCGCMEWVEYRWNLRKMRRDKYILGFNYGH